MKTNKTFYAIVMLLIVVALSVAVMPSSAQDDWPEGCELPGLEAAMSAANDAQTNGDVAAFVGELSVINHWVDRALEDCLEAAVEDGIDMTGTDLLGADLQEADLREANLLGAYLWEANLQGAGLHGANLDYAMLIRANLRGANLQRADLSYARLQGADLSHANLQGADLTNALFDETTILPDDTLWTPDTDMARFTDPMHPDFWDPCVELEELPWYCDDSDQ
jgi:hypothetical protein